MLKNEYPDVANMKTPVYKMDVYVLDFDKYGPENAIDTLEQLKYLYANVVNVEVRRFKGWASCHSPASLNYR